MSDLANRFDQIYANGLWGKQLSSGPGSWHEPLVNAYVDTIGTFLESERLSGVCNAVDLGCGDFNIGSKIAPKCKSIMAIDISQKVIDYCRNSFIQNGVTFICADARTFIPEECDIIFIRQVFQHLSNSDIQRILSNLNGVSGFVAITEHIPSDKFVANLDIESGTPHTRLSLKSGVDITQKGFKHNLALYKETLNYYGFGGNIKTSVYQQK